MQRDRPTDRMGQIDRNAKKFGICIVAALYNIKWIINFKKLVHLASRPNNFPECRLCICVSVCLCVSSMHHLWDVYKCMLHRAWNVGSSWSPSPSLSPPNHRFYKVVGAPHKLRYSVRLVDLIQAYGNTQQPASPIDNGGIRSRRRRPIAIQTD